MWSNNENLINISQSSQIFIVIIIIVLTTKYKHRFSGPNYVFCINNEVIYIIYTLCAIGGYNYRL